MSSVTGSIVTLLVGVAVIGTTWSGTYANYVKVGLRWPLLVAGFVLVTVATASLVSSFDGRRDRGGHTVAGVGGLLVVFVVALLLAPPPLGADAAAGRTPNRTPLAAAPDAIERLPPVAETVTPAAIEPESSTTSSTRPDPATTTIAGSVAEGPAEAPTPEADVAPPTTASPGSAVYAISLYDLVGYSYFAPEEVVGVPFELVGFAAPEPDIAGAFRLTRYAISCCAADAFPLQVALADPPFVPDTDQWVTAVAVWHGELTAVDEYGDGVPVMEVVSLTPIDPPDDPYES